MIKLTSLPTITLCNYRKFTEGEYHITRCITDYVLILMMDGSLSFTEDGNEVLLTAHEWYIQLPGLKQSATQPSSDAHYFYIHFTCTPHEETYLMMNKTGNFIPHHIKDLCDSLLKLNTLSGLHRLEYERDFLYLLKLLLLHSEKNISPKVLTANRAFRLIEENYQHQDMAKYLESQLHLSYHYIYKLVKEHKSIAPIQYMTQLRLDKAKELLSNTDQTVESIAFDIGFKDVSVFYKAFKKHIKMTPLKWRQDSRLLR